MTILLITLALLLGRRPGWKCTAINCPVIVVAMVWTIIPSIQKNFGRSINVNSVTSTKSKDSTKMKLLHINASPRKAESRSLEVARSFVSQLETSQALETDRIDLFDDKLPEFGTLATTAKMALFTGQEQTEAQKDVWAQIKEIFDRFAAADVILINVPMWNNGLPYKLKQYIDIVTQPGWAFGFDPKSGYSGLLTGKKAVIVHASGVWHEGIQAGFGSDFVTPYLTDWLNFIGIADIEHVRFQPTVLNADPAGTEAEAKNDAKRIAGALILKVATGS